eukprot:Gb_18534 [translate_table: standard]
MNCLLQHALRRICTDSQWDYAVFWRISPRNYPPPKWDGGGGMFDRSKVNKRNWIIVWEDGFCDFAACARSGPNTNLYEDQKTMCLQPELFFKMSHEVYCYGEGLMGKIAADNSYKWVHKEPPNDQLNFLSSLRFAVEPLPRTWESQFKLGIQTIAIVAVSEGLVQLGSLHKSVEDLNFVNFLQRMFSYLQSIPGVFAIHPPLPSYYRRRSQAKPTWSSGGNDSNLLPPTVSDCHGSELTLPNVQQYVHDENDMIYRNSKWVPSELHAVVGVKRQSGQMDIMTNRPLKSLREQAHAAYENSGFITNNSANRYSEMISVSAGGETQIILQHSEEGRQLPHYCTTH